MTEYQWKTFAYNKVNPNLAGAYIEHLTEEEGFVTPYMLVKRSEDVDAPLHPLFEWDDTVAAEKFRIEQGRGVLRNLVIVREETPDHDSVTVRAFVNVTLPDDEENKDTARGWVSIGRALNDDTMRNELLISALLDIQAFERKYSTLKDSQKLSAVFDAIAEVLEANKELLSQGMGVAEG